MLLAIDTSTRYAGVALADGGRVVSCRSWYSAVNHTAELMPAVAETLGAAGLTVDDLEGIGVALGPGGFSALRVGMSVAKGLALAADKPLAGVGTLDLEAWPYRESGLPVCALLDAGRGEVATALFKEGNRVQPDSIVSPEELAAEVGETTLFCGEGLQPYAELLRQRLGRRAVTAGNAPAARLYALAALGRERLEVGDGDEVASLQPYYLRMPTIGGPKRRDRAAQQS